MAKQGARGVDGLTATEHQIIKALGISAEEFLAARNVTSGGAVTALNSADGLTAIERQVIKALGISAEEFLAARKGSAGRETPAPYAARNDSFGGALLFGPAHQFV